MIYNDYNDIMFITAIAAKQTKSYKDFHITCVDSNWYTVKKFSFEEISLRMKVTFNYTYRLLLSL